MKKILTLFIAFSSFVAVPASFAGDYVPGKLAVTAWNPLWNNWEECLTPAANGGSCNLPDFGTPNVNAGVLYLTGGVTKRNGDITLVGTTYETQNRAPYSPNIDLLQNGTGLQDAALTEYNVVLRTHGRYDRHANEQQLIGYFDEGCSELGGPNTCADLQFAVFPIGVDTSPVYESNGTITGPYKERGCAKIFRDDGVIRVVLHTNMKGIMTRNIRKLCGWNKH